MKDEKQIHRWLNGELSESELEIFKQTQDYKDYIKIVSFSEKLQTPQIDPEKTLKELKTRLANTQKTKVLKPNFKWAYRIAAVLTILLVTSYFVFYNQATVVKTTLAQTTTAQLPDNSEVVLNAGSKIRYKEKNWQKNRELDLEGEAYFKVSKGSDFEVKTSLGLINVLGTQFNVKVREDYFEVQCYEGKVAVSYKNKKIALPAGSKFRVVNKKVKMSQNLSDTKPSWLLQESTFDAVPYSQVIAELERQYDLKIEMNNIDASQLFTGSFTHKNKNVALQSITKPLRISYEIDGENVKFFRYADK